MKNLMYFLFLSLTTLLFIACQSKTGETSTTEEGTVETVATATGELQTFNVVPAGSTIHWEGYKPALGTTHVGTVQVSEGKLTVQGNVVQSGSFVIDMSTITDTDLEGDRKAKLEAHLKGTAEGKEDDFFNVTKYPTGKFEITNVTALENDPEANQMIYGNLTIKEVTNPVSFKANVVVNNGTLTASTPMFRIDRTEWGIKVLSKKFFENLKDGFVDDQFGLRIELRAETGTNI
jgi:polyisoprenoid-binding protein YceI